MKAPLKKKLTIVCLVIFLKYLVGCGIPQSDRTNSEGLGETKHATATEQRQCKIRYARGFDISYQKGCKVITIFDPEDAQKLKRINRFVLVPKGTRPSFLPEGTVIEIPVRRVALRSATHVPFFYMLGRVDRIVAITEGKYVYNPEVRALIKQKKIAEVGVGSGMTAQFNIEKLFSLQPDLVVSWWTRYPAYAAHLKAQEAGFPVALIADYYETTPLGRTEWVKFVAAFLDAEEKAERVFTDIERRYIGMRKKTEAVQHRPTVMFGSSYQGTWYVAGGKSYFASLIKDAGGRYIWDDDESTGTRPVNSETAMLRAKNADFWFTFNMNHLSLASLLSEDNRYSLFKAFKTKNIYNNMGRIGPDGGNDYYQGTVARPDLLLADVIAILHPELLPNHELIWHVRLPEFISSGGTN